MIASVRGTVLVRRPDHVVVETGGIGYRLAVSAETLKSVPAHGKEVMLHTHMVVREDSISLYGFASEEERDLFVHLNSVSGIGPKVALAVLGTGSPRELVRAIATGDAKRFQAAPGVGKRTAQRLVMELRERVAGELAETSEPQVEPQGDDARLLAREGLVGLGYSLLEAERLLEGEADGTPEELIQRALRRAAEASGAR